MILVQLEYLRRLNEDPQIKTIFSCDINSSRRQGIYTVENGPLATNQYKTSSYAVSFAGEDCESA